MAVSPPSLGDQPKPELVLSRTEVELPRTRKELVSTFESILVLGGVQKVVVELGKPIQVVRLVDKSSMPPVLDAPENDLWAQLRNNTLEELLLDTGVDPYRVLYHGFERLAGRKARPAAIFVHSHEQLRQWLKISTRTGPSMIFGVDVIEEADVPDDAAILVGRVAVDPNLDQVVGVRLPVDLPKPQVVSKKEVRK